MTPLTDKHLAALAAIHQLSTVWRYFVFTDTLHIPGPVLGMLVRRGLLERNGTAGLCQYRLTDAGRDALRADAGAAGTCKEDENAR